MEPEDNYKCAPCLTLNKRVIAINQTLTRRIVELETELRIAQRDSLTKLPGRLELIEEAGFAIAEKELPVSLIFMDLNGFKTINDTLGHSAGNSLLIQFATFLIKEKAALEKEGQPVIVARLHGDEFAILLPYLLKEEADKIVSRIKSDLSECHFEVEGRKFSIVSAMGVASTEFHGCSTAEDLLKYADHAMYTDKEKMKQTTTE